MRSTVNYDEHITFENCSFGSVKLTKNTDINKYKYFGYGIGFGGLGAFSFPSGGFGQNVKIFGVDISSSVHANNKKKKIIIFGEGITQGLDDTTFCLSLHYNGANSCLFVNGTEIIKFKAKDSEIVANPLCLGNTSEDFSNRNMKKTALIESVYDFSVDYDDIAVDDIIDIHKYLMEKNNIK